MSDIVERLRAWTELEPPFKDEFKNDLLSAADAIEERDAKIVRLRALITEWAEAMGDKADSFGGLARYEAARDALREEANR